MQTITLDQVLVPADRDLISPADLIGLHLRAVSLEDLLASAHASYAPEAYTTIPRIVPSEADEYL